MYKYIRGFSRKLKDIGANINSKGIPLIRHLVKIYLYPKSNSADHWVHEVYAFLHSIDTVKGKNDLPSEGFIYYHVYEFNRSRVNTIIKSVLENYGGVDYSSDIYDFLEEYIFWLSEELSMKGEVLASEVSRKLRDLMDVYNLR